MCLTSFMDGSSLGSTPCIDVWFTLSHLAEERELLRNVEVENSRLQSDCESLKLRLEGVQSEKTASSSEEFEDFQKMRQVLLNLQLHVLLFLSHGCHS